MTKLIVKKKITSKVEGVTNAIAFYATSPNTAPILGPIAISSQINTIYSFTQSIINDKYSDVDGDSLLTVQVRSLPLIGVLNINNAPAKINQEIALVDIANMKFIPQANQYGREYVTFNIRVKDNGVPSNLWSSESTITFEITKTNSVPTVTNSEVIVLYQGDYIFTLNDLLTDYNDAEGNLASFFEFTSIPPVNLGTLLLDGSLVTQQQLPLILTTSDILTERLQYIDSGNISDEKSILIDYIVHDNS